MNRHERRAKAEAKPVVSVALIQRHLRDAEQALEQARLVLLAVVRMNGRVRVPLAVLNAVRPGADRVESRQVGDEIVFTFVESTMAVPGGVTEGKAG